MNPGAGAGAGGRGEETKSLPNQISFFSAVEVSPQITDLYLLNLNVEMVKRKEQKGKSGRREKESGKLGGKSVSREKNQMTEGCQIMS